MKDKLSIAINTPWKLYQEILMYLIKPFVLLYLRINNVEIGKGSKFYGFPKVYKHKGSTIKIGDNFECRSWWYSNPLGVNHPTIICTWNKGAKIIIGNDVGITGGSIVSAKNVSVGNGVLIGANVTIIDTDFHPIKSSNRRYSEEDIGLESIDIGNNVFIGTNAIILKGIVLKSNSVVSAGEVVKI